MTVRFTKDLRVLVKKTDDGIVLNAPGTVTRVTTGGDVAWIALDERSRQGGAHPFGADDPTRSTHVRAAEGDCEPLPENRAGRRAAERARAEGDHVPIADFGKDHWSTFGYIETRIVDHGGQPLREHMRCHNGRHPMLAHRGGDAARYPTYLKGMVPRADHDDWDCLGDCEAAGLLLNIGTAVNPVYRLTHEGSRMAAALREHKAKGGSFGTFTAPEAAPAPEPALPRSGSLHGRHLGGR